MIAVLGCETARELLPSFVDGELVVDRQVEVEAHLRWCRTCAAHVSDLRVIGDALRLRVPASVLEHEMDTELRSRQRDVLSLVKAEQDQAFGARMGRMFEDLHVVWAGLGATLGVFACILLTTSVIWAVDKRASDSLAEIMDALGDPGSERNPMSLDGRVLPPSLAMPDLPDDSPAWGRIPQGDAMFAIATVVTREGRISDYEVLLSHYPASDDGTVMHATNVGASPSKADISYLRNAATRARFAPAQAGGSPVAVSMVWLLARTTVKGSLLPFDFDEFREVRARFNRSRS